jgi:2-(1,2-epoxy-1,2-dihydrophenyl)acetyl-CoA isomerase
MDYEKITYELQDNVAIVRLNDPGALNATSTPMMRDLGKAFARAQREARAVYFTSVGRAFCAGANLADGGWDITDPDRDLGWRLEAYGNPFLLSVRELDIPVITGVRGAAVGVGCGLALCGDIIVASETAFFLPSFRNVGLAPDGGLSYFLSRTVGRVRAMEMVMLAEKLPAAKALDWGLVTRVVPDDQLDNEALAIAKNLAGGAYSLGIIRKQAWAALDASMEQQLVRERVDQRKAGRSNDFAEGARSFREKRKPEFKGE